MDVHKVSVHSGCFEFLTEEPGLIGTGGAEGGNSGFQAINLAIQFGARRIVLVGFDMRADLGLHWHGQHGKGLNNPKLRNFIAWRRALDRAADQVKELGVEIMNTSPVSALTAYPMVGLEDVLLQSEGDSAIK